MEKKKRLIGRLALGAGIVLALALLVLGGSSIAARSDREEQARRIKAEREQLDLFGAESRSHAVGPAIDAVRARFGYDAIRLGAIGTTRWLEQRPVPTRSPPDADENPPGDPDLE